MPKLNPNSLMPRIAAEASRFQQEVASTIDQLNHRKYLKVAEIGYDQCLRDHKLPPYDKESAS